MGALAPGGFRDLLDAPSPTTVTSAIMALATQIQALHTAGARRFVVANMVDISLSPSVSAVGPAAQAQVALVVGFNSGLDSALASLATLPGIKLARADMFGSFGGMVADPGSYGFTDVTDRCFDGTSVCPVPSQYLFWDTINPTTRCHQFLGSELWRAVAATAPDLIHRDGFE